MPTLMQLVIAYIDSVETFTSNDVSDNIPTHSVQSVRDTLNTLKKQGAIKNIRTVSGVRGNPYLMKAVK